MNKKISTIFFAFLFSLMLIGLASASLTVSNKPTSLTVFQNSDVTSSFTLKNDGTYNITDIIINSSTMPDSTDISFNITSIPLLMPGETKKIGFTISADSNADLGSEEITVYADGSNSTSFSFDLSIKQNYCSDGQIGSKLKITLDNPDNGDDFYAGENISIEVNVENRDNDEIDFTIEAQLYDLTTGEEIDSADFDGSLDEDEDDDYELYIKVPSDIDKNDDYAINVKVYEDGNEEEQCKEDSVNIDLKKRTHDLNIEKVILNSAEACNAPLDLTIKVENTGSNDEDDTTVTIYNQALGINLQKTSDIDEDDTENFYFSTVLPVVSPGSYDLSIEVESEDASDSKTVILNLQTNCKAQTKNAQIFVMPQNAGNINQDTIFKATVTNSGDVATTYNVAVQNYQTWATLTSINPTQITLNPGQSQDVTIILKPLSSASSLNTFQIKLTYGSETKTQDATLKIGTNIPITGQSTGFFSNLGKNIWLLIINIVLILIVISLIILVAIKPSKKTEVKEARLRKNGKRK